MSDAVKSAACGGFAGACVSVTLQPFDVVRTRMHTDVIHTQKASALRTFRTILAEGGVQRLWRGTTATSLRVGGGAFLHFHTLHVLRTLVGDPSSGSAIATHALLGGASRGLAVVIMCPVTTVKTRMEASHAGAQNYRSVIHALTDVVKAEGLLALWRGLPAAMLANAPFSAIHYATYRTAQEAARDRLGLEGAVANFAAGAAASVLATTATQPFDVIRTRQMLNVGNSLADLRAAGLRGLFAGFLPRLVKRPLQTTLVWTLYEELYKAAGGPPAKK
ncbi:mitochondrial carrier domain-containing protein [Pelagophyceae sp. CCMP2097]|nr:mitochondrial carrier domain-containing protein [Pelagophyceae sp. CCMP2097]|mmetsp:Transcript_6970/g.22620  ORF Transcript_6970/g.22620 Transcript_6970/m.22620 type:complete len:277 (+) Transcript_6970:303-1133(+)